MPFTIGELKQAIQNKPDDTPIMLLFNGVIKDATGMSFASNDSISIVHSSGGPRTAKHFNPVEEGLIGWLHSNGMSDDDIAELLERPVDAVQKRMKKIGIGK